MKNKIRAAIDGVQRHIGKFGCASIYYAASLDRYVCHTAYLTLGELEEALADLKDVRAERFLAEGARWIWLTPVHLAGPAVPRWAEIRGWGEEAGSSAAVAKQGGAS